jgi:NADP-dependent 3-hydroxy acid dehydrogenase YdfG
VGGLDQKGAKVVIVDVSDERGEALAREVGSGSLYVSTDCMDEGAIARAVPLPEIVSSLADLAAGGASSPGGRTS